jgi:hypothetical protein
MRIILCLASHTEQIRTMPADSIISNPIGMVTHAITIGVPPERVWPWVAQLGAGRAGWYSYDQIDNGGRPSAWSIMPEYQQIAPGDVLPATPSITDVFRVSAVQPPYHLVLIVPEAHGGIQVSWEFLLVPIDRERTRLIVRGRIAPHWPTATQARPRLPHRPILIERIYDVLAHTPQPLMLLAASIGHYVMESRMLRGIKHRAEA